MPLSQTVNDLRALPNIVGELGLAIARAQKQLNIDYLNSLQVLAGIAKDVLGAEGTEAKEFLEHLVKSAAPARYQFTETSVMVRLDLAESKDSAVTVGGGVGFAGIVVNGSYASGRSTDYSAGAELRCVIHAVLPQANDAAFTTLLGRAKELAIDPAKAIGSPLDQEVLKAAKEAGAAARIKQGG
jgi:hypothetical protein